jgi:hypothetical protein
MKEWVVSPIKKSPRAKSKAVKPVRRAAPASSKLSAAKNTEKKEPRSVRGGEPGPDERRPEIKADEIYGDTKIPEHIRKH